MKTINDKHNLYLAKSQDITVLFKPEVNRYRKFNAESYSVSKEGLALHQPLRLFCENLGFETYNLNNFDLPFIESTIHFESDCTAESENEIENNNETINVNKPIKTYYTNN